ncbi:MAG: molybdopterin-binding protein [Desulfobacteraceae bacterium]|nr:molybdopterin-binding protein [Desulfobacteraceae bacterium]
MIEVVKIEEAVGCALAHDITEIIPGKFKGPAFLKGHVLQTQDLDHLRRLGKNHLYVLSPRPDQMHEDDAAIALADALSGSGVYWYEAPREGKISLRASFSGLLKVDVRALTQFNLIGDIMCATRHTNSIVYKRDEVAATRAIPLLVEKQKVEAALEAAGDSAQGVIRVLPMKRASAGVLITGDEVYSGKIQDRFEPVIRKKVCSLGGEVKHVAFLPDNDELIARAALDLVDKGVNILITTGGMSVDPDDRTRYALQKAGAKDMVYGSAVLPGAMFMVAELKGVPLLGIPACGMYAAATIFDLIYPRVLAGDKINRHDVAVLGHGGLCLKCKSCRFPDCAFGK